MEFAGATFDHAVALEHARDCTKEALAVEKETLALHVFAVESRLHGNLELVAAVDLRPAGKAHGHVVRAVLVAFGNQVVLVPQRRARADDAHGTAKDVEHLREFIQARLAEEPAHPRNPFLGIAQLVRRGVLGRIDAHGAELVDVKMGLMQANALLLKEHRALAVELDGNSNKKHRECEYQNAEARKNDIDKTLEKMLVHHLSLKTELQGTLVASGTTAIDSTTALQSTWQKLPTIAL